MTALVTGASRGIGREVALGMAAAGADVVGLARSTDKLATLAEEVRGLGPEFLGVTADLEGSDAIPPAVAEAREWHGRIDVLINAAGVMIRGEPPGVSPDSWDRLFAVNARAPFLISQEVAAGMLVGDGGSIVNVTSLAGEVVTGASVIYQTSKAALIHMTRALAVRWGPKVRVNAVGPGYIRTDMSEDFLDAAQNRGYVEERTALQRVGVPADVVGAVLFLASPAASYITGQNLRVDGGWKS